MIGSSRSCRSRIRPSSTPKMIPASEPETNPTSTRTILIDTSAKISPLRSIGTAVRMTSSGGGIRNGLNINVDKRCQMEKAISSDAADSKTARYGALRPLCAGAEADAGADLLCSQRRPGFFCAPGTGGRGRERIDMPLIELIGSGDIGREQRLNFMK